MDEEPPIGMLTNQVGAVSSMAAPFHLLIVTIAGL